MPTILQFRRGTTAQNDAFTGALGEVSIDTQKDTLRVHDGSTAGGSEIVSTAATQTLTNKTLTTPTLTTPVISTISNTGTLTLPTSTDTLVGRDTTDTLTNKTLTSPTITNPTITGLALGGASFTFEGSTADDYETTLTATDPTADRTITLPDQTGTVALESFAIAQSIALG